MATAGIDVSDFQPPAVAEQAWRWGARFMFAKASQGAAFRARSLGAHYDAAGQLGYARGAYHFYEAVETWQANVGNFLAAIAGRTWELPPVLDYEEGSGRAPVGDVLSFLEAVEQRVGRTPMLYGDHPWLASVLGGDGRFARFPLWLAGYPNAYNHPQPAIPPAVSITAPAPWTKATVWQFSDSGGSLDLNVCDDLAALTGTPSPTPGEFTVDADAKARFDAIDLRLIDLTNKINALTLIAQDTDNTAHADAAADAKKP